MVDNSHRDEQLEQVRVCAEIGIKCTNSNPAKRPDTQHIINRLKGLVPMDEYITTGVITTANLDKLYETMHSLNLDIKRCFEICSIFPRGFEFRRDELVRLWIAQGFIKTSCPTDRVEDIAGRYIQELVSCSFLQPSETSNGCFKIHDVLHDILEKVAGNCFRIENASSHRGEGWEGDVPRHIQHLFIQNYDGELIIERIIGLEYLRTLIVYVVGEDTPVEEKVIDSICKRLPNLRVLAIAFSQEHDLIWQPKFSVPESVGQLKYLRYLAFRAASCEITLPSTLNNLQHIQILDFGGGYISGFTFAELVNLRHIFCYQYLVKLLYVGRLRSLQTLPGFTLSNEQGCELKELRDLNKLRGALCNIENVKSKGQALEANLAAKRLTQLKLFWGYGVNKGYSPEVAADVLEGLCPHVGLKTLLLDNFVGSRYPDWMVGKHNGGPKYLQELHLCKCIQPGPAVVLSEAFPHLRVLEIIGCSWVTLPDNIEYVISLKHLSIYTCKNIRSIPSLPPSLEKFTVFDCNDEFKESCQTVGHPNWQKIEHINVKRFLG